MLIGNVGREPDIRYVDAGVCVASLVLATTERGYRLQNGTEVPDRTEWHNITLWRGLAETVEKYVHKGDKLYIEGKYPKETDVYTPLTPEEAKVRKETLKEEKKKNKKKKDNKKGTQHQLNLF